MNIDDDLQETIFEDNPTNDVVSDLSGNDSDEEESISVKSESEQLMSQIEELTLALQRERADSINIKRRAEEDSARSVTLGKAAIIKKLIPVLDTTLKARELIPETELQNKSIEGLLSTLDALSKVLTNEGLREIESVGCDFNPEVHLALQTIEGDGSKKQKSGTVAEELQRGYMLGDEVLRVSSVVVFE